ncbi:DUF6882 domain-containing protein [Gimesia panareensis]|uniref:DUF6882 domain-containing protein n=1 Tax=Gimesia panareensis TaxID=2527978 RepID=UPI0011895CDE|nr:DUF6882 domain-containing protein [Gimesia panareensis]QDU53295.1 hypothetical protein Pan110_56800 [Gimesia panareensis]
MDYDTLLNQHLCFALDRQLLLADLVEDLDWGYNVSTGILSFGDRYEFQAEILGTEADGDASWLWSWANEMSSLPPERTQAALKLKQLGEAEGIPELSEARHSLSVVNGHALGMIAVGQKLGQAYYHGPHDQGAVLLLIVEPQMPWAVENHLQRITTTFPQIIAQMEVEDHQNALFHYLQHYDLEPEAMENALVVRENGAEILHASFDDLNRLQELKSSLC